MEKKKIDPWIRVDMALQNPQVRACNFDEVSLGYKENEAVDEASRCMGCKKPKCVPECPVHIDIPRFIKHIEDGNLLEAYKTLSEATLLPSVCGRVCPQENQCEGSCIRNRKGESVAIGRLERYVGDWARANGIKPEKPSIQLNKKVAVIGSGPAGIACAGDLAKLGYKVTIFEALHKPGGVLLYGIPEFRLPKQEVVEAEIDNLKHLGVEIVCNTVVGRSITIDQLMNEEGFDAVFIGSGAGLPKFMGIPGENAKGVFSANEYLTRSNLMGAFDVENSTTPIYRAKKAAIIGGGNVAMDAARTALRLGAEVHVIYRRSMDELPARKEEIEHAEEEGIIFDVLTNPVEILKDENGWVRAIKCVKMELGEPDESGRRRPKVIDGSEFEMEMDAVIMSLGTSPNPLIKSTTKGLETNKWGCINVDENGMTSIPGIFAGGDAVTGAATVILAMGAGRQAAAGIHSYLTNK